MPSYIYTLVKQTGQIARGADLGGGTPDAIEIWCENVDAFEHVLERWSTVALLKASTTGADIGSAADDGIWGVYITLSLMSDIDAQAFFGIDQDGSCYNVVTRFNLTESGGLAFLRLVELNPDGSSSGNYTNWAGTGLSVEVSPSSNSHPLPYPMLYTVRLTFDDPPGFTPPETLPVDDFDIAPPSDLTGTYYPAVPGVSDAYIALEWVDNATNELGFVVESAWGPLEADFGESAILTTPDRTTFSDTNVSRAHVNRYRVFAYKADKRSSASNTIEFPAIDPPEATIDPAIGITAGGDTVTIIGVDSLFIEGATVTFGRYYGTFEAATDVVVVDANTITCKTPPHKNEVCSVVIGNLAGDDIILHDVFTYVRPDNAGGAGPGSITPDLVSGPVTGGATITLTVTGVTFASAPLVFFGDTQATDVVLVSPSVITCTVPAHVAGTVRIRIQGS